MVVLHTKYNFVLTVYDNGHVSYTGTGLSFDIYPADVHHVLLQEPKLFSGVIDFRKDEKNVLSFPYLSSGQEREMSMCISISPKEKAQFREAYGILATHYKVILL